MIQPNSKIRWGVLGYAQIAREAVMPAIQRSSNGVVHAMGSRDPAKLEECRRRFGCSRLYEGYAQVVADPEVDAIYIPLPNALHCEWAIRAMEKGKHVLCEKPIALNAEECRRMIATAERQGVKLMEAFMYRYTDCVKKVVSVLRRGVLGEVRFLSSTFRFHLADAGSIKYQPALGGGALYDVGCYPLNFAGLVADELARIQSAATSPASSSRLSPESVSVQAVKEGGVDVLSSALLKYPNGLVAALHCGFNSQPQIYAEIVGTRGVLQVPNPFLGEAVPLSLLIDGKEAESIPVETTDRYRLEVEDFADAILGNRAPGLSLAETERNMVLLDRLYAACG